eukprot:TRINITY_DN1709_c0_g2_i1.p1 TRINITY_DN1709_c0_g2~~TRINITY_DN1709_c0_g2_i1.p1  ORF type:complete len:213 (+),score=32.42 TRINITY_DN1709_c0_g2_i1:55-693(+)
MEFFGRKKTGTFHKKRDVKEGTKRYDLAQYAQSSLGSGNLKEAVQCPKEEDLNEWLAYNVIDFFNQVNMLYDSVNQFCTKESCPVMNAGPKYEYHWADGQTIKKAIKCSAPEYVEYLMTWIQKLLDNEKVFPSKVGNEFPKNFLTIIKNIFKRLFRVYAHLYLSHIKQIQDLQVDAHLNTSFKHFIHFVEHHQLIAEKEKAPLTDLIKKMLA